MAEGRRERVEEVHAMRTRYDVHRAGYKTAEDIGLRVRNNTRLNIKYTIRLVILGIQAVLIKYPKLAADILIFKGVVYYRGKLVELATRWAERRARKEMRSRHQYGKKNK